MTQREIYLGCLMGFFRARHERRPKYRRTRKPHHAAETVSTHRDAYQMVRHYIRKIREIEPAPGHEVPERKPRPGRGRRECPKSPSSGAGIR